jgi:prepilin-type N-terminal cleavage/methylation domain-containing protein
MNTRGFTLIETLVALVIFSLSCMALLDLFSTSTRAKAAHDSLVERLARAEALLLELDLARSFEPERRGTDADGYAWAVVMTPITPMLVQVDLVVTDRAGREVRLQTLRSTSELSIGVQP